MKILFYGRLGERIGREIELEMPAVSNVAELRSALAGIYPDEAVELLQQSRACVEDMIVNDDHIIVGTGTVEFFPPLSGG